MDGLPRHYFRIRENGAAVFRVDDSNRNRRLEMEQIAVVNVRSGEVKPQGGRTLTAQDSAAISAWLEDRRATLGQREAETPERCIEALNLAAQWAQSKADAEELEAATDRLLLAMHDLRGVLVRKRADRIARDAGTEGTEGSEGPEGD